MERADFGLQRIESTSIHAPALTGVFRKLVKIIAEPICLARPVTNLDSQTIALPTPRRHRGTSPRQYRLASESRRPEPDRRRRIEHKLVLDWRQTQPYGFRSFTALGCHGS
ncbi:hypothetical protein ASE61_11805 [Bosea sp. Root670]|nr:hypothetical protein ASE61_11805 [Bosea sp. Root670]